MEPEEIGRRVIARSSSARSVIDRTCRSVEPSGKSGLDTADVSARNRNGSRESPRWAHRAQTTSLNPRWWS